MREYIENPSFSREKSEIPKKFQVGGYERYGDSE